MKNRRNNQLPAYDLEYFLNSCRGAPNLKDLNDLHPFYDRVLDLIKKWSKSKILDVGCGRGEVAFLSAKLGRVSYGIDISREAVEFSLKRKLILPDKYREHYIIKVMDAQKMQFKDEYFDTVFALDITEHLYDRELYRLLGEIKRVLCPGGILLIHTPNALIMKPIILLTKLIGLKLKMLPYHVNEKGMRSLVGILKNDFTIEKKWFEKERNFWSNITIERGKVIRGIARITDKFFDNPTIDSLIRKSFLMDYFSNNIWIIASKN